MSDLISRQAALYMIMEQPPEPHYPSWYAEQIKALPPAQQWIPCSKRLPEHDYYGETFQATIQCEHVDGWDDYVSGYADWTPNGWDIQSYYQGQIKVVAWMPLPKPWEGEQNEKV